MMGRVRKKQGVPEYDSRRDLTPSPQRGRQMSKTASRRHWAEQHIRLALESPQPIHPRHPDLVGGQGTDD